MKDATGELSTTVIAIVAIAAIAAVFTVFLLPMLKTQITLTQACNNGPGYTMTGKGYTVTCTTAGGTVTGTSGNSKICNPDADAADQYKCTYVEEDSE